MDQPRYPNSDADPVTHTSGLPPHNLQGGRPRWVRIAAFIAAIALVALVAGLHLTGGLGPGVQ